MKRLLLCTIILALGNFFAADIEAQSLLQQAQKQSGTSASSSKKTSTSQNASSSAKKSTASETQPKKSTAKKTTKSSASGAVKKKKNSTSQSSYNNMQVTAEPEVDDGFNAAEFAYNLYQLRDFAKIKQSVEAQTEYTFTKQEENDTYVKYVRNSDAQEALVIKRDSKDTPYCNYVDMETGISSRYEMQRRLEALAFACDNPETTTGQYGSTEVKFQHKNETLRAVYWTSSNGSEHSILMSPTTPSTWPAYFQFISTLVKINDVEQICERLNSLCWYHSEGPGNLWEKRKKVAYKSPGGGTTITIKRKNKKSTALGEIEIKLDISDSNAIDSWIRQAGFSKTSEKLNQSGLLGGTYDFRDYAGINRTQVSLTTQRDAILGSGGVQNYITFKPY